jgi:hypothetical protein
MFVAILLAGVQPGQGAPLKRGKSGAPAYTQPAENILIIVADIQRHLADDVYRFPYPTDVTGQNVFRAAVVRLANYETLYPGKLADVVALARAQAFEKLGAYDEAGRSYQIAQKSGDRAISSVSGEGFERTKKFSRVIHQAVDFSGLRTYERDLQKKIRDLEDLSGEFKSTPHASLALLERERAQMQLAEFYVTMRFIQPFSTDDALLQLKRNIDQNRESKKRYAHHMMLADLYYDIARQYTLKADPEGPDFSQREFEGYANAARSEYHVVEQADGYPEKLEARAKQLALEAFMETVVDRAR